MAKWIEDPQGRLEVEKVTEEIKLPVWKANYKGKFREFWNECWEKIEDSFLKLKKSNEGKEPAIEDKQTAFNKAFGTVEDTVLEGNKFTQMTGKDYGGILNIAGQKEAGKAYWDNNTKKLYICKNNNSDISPNVNNYIPFDSNSLLERLENLFKYEVKNATSRVTNCKNATLMKIKLDRLCIMHYQVDVDVKASLNTKITVYFDETFADSPFATITDNNSGTSELANPVLDWATTTQVTMSNFASGFSLMVIGYI